MCGIAGMAGRAGEEARPSVEAIVASQRHRGPDAAGARDLGGCTLGHARLRIIDLSAAGDQPMANEDGTVWVTFNGEIYNFPELRRELEDRGHRFRSATDTEVLVHLYEECGEGVAKRLRGMFSFAIWDSREGRLLLARDRLGIKPLYYHTEGEALTFASEVRALGRDRRDLDPGSVAAFLRLGWIAGPSTILSGVREVPPGHLLLWREGTAEVRPYWTPPLAEPNGHLPTLEDVRDALRDSVQRHLVADVPVGLFLSSGVDSGALAHLACQVAGEVRAYTVSFDAAGDESVLAGETARQLGIQHSVVPVAGSEVLQSLDRIVADMDQPTVDGVNSWVVSRAVAEVGLVVALSGLGGDELFEGYSTFRHVPRLVRLGRALAPVSPLVARAAAVAGRSRRAAHSRSLRALEAVALGGWAPAYAAVRGLFSAGELERLWPPWNDLAGGDGSLCRGGSDAVGSTLGLELANYLPYQLLRDTDAMSMAHSIEVRVPLLDDRVVDVALRCREGIEGVRGKRLLASAAGPSMVAITERPKRTFTLPFDAWMRGALRDRVAASLDRLAEGEAGFSRPAIRELWEGFGAGRVGWRPVWALTVLGMWLDDR